MKELMGTRLSQKNRENRVSQIHFNLSVLKVLVLVFFCSNALADQLVIISPHWEGMRYEFENGFQKWRKSQQLSPVSIVWRDVGGTSEIVRFVQSEFQGKSNDSKQKGIGIDLVFGGGVDPFVTFKKSGVLAALDINPEILKRVSAEVNGMPLYDSENFWFAPTMSAFGIFCNQKVLSTLKIPAPQSWEDLLKPELASWITSADPRRSGSAHMFYEIILQAYGWDQGWDIIFGLSGNYRTFLANSSQAILDVVNGEVACSFAIDSQANAQISSAEKDNYIFTVPSQNSLFNGDGIAVLRDAPHYEIAKSFVEFSLSEAGQKLLYAEKGNLQGPLKYDLNRLPVLPELFTDIKIANLNPFKKQGSEPFRFDSHLSSNRWEALNDLLGIFVIEAKDAGRIGKKECQKNLPKRDEIDKLLEQKVWADQVERNRLLSQWRGSAVRCEEEKKFDFNMLPFLLISISICILLLRKIVLKISQGLKSLHKS